MDGAVRGLICSCGKSRLGTLLNESAGRHGQEGSHELDPAFNVVADMTEPLMIAFVGAAFTGHIWRFPQIIQILLTSEASLYVGDPQGQKKCFPP